MANTLTNLIPDFYNALDVVSREVTGFIPAVTADMTMERAALNQTVRSPVAPASAASDVTPAVTPPNDGDQVIGNVDMSITKVRRVPIRWNGEQSRGINNGGPGVSNIILNQFAQAMRTLVNEVETDLGALHSNASRAYGTAAATPFGTAGDFTDASNVLKILKDNGAPGSDNQLVINTSARIVSRQTSSSQSRWAGQYSAPRHFASHSRNGYPRVCAGGYFHCWRHGQRYSQDRRLCCRRNCN